MKNFLWVVAVTSATSIASAQSMNIDFNWQAFGGLIPTSGYAAAGSAGVWNNAVIGFGPIPINMSLVDLAGASTAANLSVTNYGPSLSTSGPWLGDDNRLMEDSIGSGSVPLPIQFSGLLSGNYDVYLYGQASSGNLTSTFTINNVSQSSSGAWAGSHVAGNSYVKFSSVSVTGGNLAINFTGNCNGIQLDFHPVPEPMTMVTLLGGLTAVGVRRRKRT